MARPPLAPLLVVAAAYFLFVVGPLRNDAGPLGLCPYTFSSLTNASQAAARAFSVPVTLNGEEEVLNPSLCDFSEGYFEARAKFRRSARRADAQLHALSVFPDDDTYTIDVAVIKGTGDGLVVHSSGVHGVEGYAGSAVQIATLDHLGARTGASLVPTLVFVHAVNPYGMAKFRRFNEHNVDLNRNALTEEEWIQALAREPNIAGYEDFHPIFNQEGPPSMFQAYVQVYFEAALNIAKHGFTHMKRAIVAAQYHRPSGVYYGGQSLEPSHVLLSAFLREHFPPTRVQGTVTWIDVHTGLGPSGLDTLMPGASGGAETAKWFPGAAGIEDVSTGAGGEVAAGYELTMGMINEFYPSFFPPSSQPLVVTQEFGTRAGVFVARAMFIENQAFVHAPSLQPRWATLSRDAFYVRTEAWKRSVLARGLVVLSQAIVRSSS